MVFICTLFFSRLIVLDPPLNLTVEMKSSINVLLKWIAPLSSHEDITGYKVDVQKLWACVFGHLPCTGSMGTTLRVEQNEIVYN